MDISAVILAGGKSRRMNGNNKAYLTYKNKTFIENIIEKLNKFDSIYVSVDEKSKYKDINLPLIEDEYKDIGPISGIYCALKNISSDYIFVVPCDMPMINEDLINSLLNNLSKDDKAVVFKDDKDRIYPLCAIYSRKSISEIEKMIQDNDYKLKNLVNNLKGKVISMKDENLNKSIFANINDPREYNRLK